MKDENQLVTIFGRMPEVGDQIFFAYSGRVGEIRGESVWLEPSLGQGAWFPAYVFADAVNIGLTAPKIKAGDRVKAGNVELEVFAIRGDRAWCGHETASGIYRIENLRQITATAATENSDG